MACILCNLERRTRWLYSDKVCVVCECETCHVPMLVFRRHGAQPSAQDEARAMEVLRHLGLVVKRKRARLIHDHSHWHLEPRG